MKTTNILYWIFTGLLAIFLLFDAYGEILRMPQGVDFITNLGYPSYIVPFLGVAKLLAAIAILVPGFPRIKEWAYAGIIIDFAGATYSIIAKGAAISQYFPMFVFIAWAFASYYFYHRRISQKISAIANPAV